MTPSVMRIFAFLPSRPLGNFIVENMVASTIKLQFDQATLIVYYRNDRPYKQGIIDMNPHIDQVFTSPAREAGRNPQTFPIDLFDVCADAPVDFKDPNWLRLRGRESDLILAGHMLVDASLPAFKRRARLVMPKAKQAPLDQELMSRGLDPERWFACVFWREPGYVYRPPNRCRDVRNPNGYLAVIEHIVRRQGGQVVRLGHPGMTPLPEDPDVIDLSGVENTVLHAHAVKRARYMLSSNTGPISFGPAFGVPTLITENMDINGVWNEEDRCITQIFIGPDGKRYRQRAALEAGLLSYHLMMQLTRTGKNPFNIIQCMPEDLRIGADTMLELTEACRTWRQSDAPDNGVEDRPNQVTFPLVPTIADPFFIDHPDL